MNLPDPDPDDPKLTWTCNPTLDELYRYIDNQVDEPQQSEFKSHLSMCTGCDDIVHFHLGLRSMLGSCREEMPPEVRQRLLDSITKLF